MRLREIEMETGKNIRSAAGHIKTHINTFNLNTNTNGSSMSVHVAFGICFKHIHTLHLVDRYDCVRKKRRMKKKEEARRDKRKGFCFSESACLFIFEHCSM